MGLKNYVYHIFHPIYLATGAMSDDNVFDEDLADVVELRHDAVDQTVGLVDEDDLHGTVVAGGTTRLVPPYTGTMMKFLNRK